MGHGDMDMGEGQCSMNASHLYPGNCQCCRLTAADALHMVLEESMYYFSAMESNGHALFYLIPACHRPPHRRL